MTTMTIAALGAVFATALAGGALAQTGNMSTGSMSTGAMSTGAMSSGSMGHMSAADTKKMTACQGMSHDMMMKNKGCMKMIKMHPDMMKSDDGMMMKK